MLIAAALALLSSASAQPIQVEGLESENVDVSATSTHLKFNTSYMNQSLTPRQVYVPEELDDTISDFSWSLSSWDSGSTSSYTIQYKTIYQDKSYNDTEDTVRRLLGDDPDVATSYPQNQFISSDSKYSPEVDGEIGSVFDRKITDDNSGYNITWDIKVEAHYEHLIINYDLIYNETGQPAETVWETQDIYSEEEPERVPFTQGSTQHIIYPDQNIQEIGLGLDNRYDKDSKEYKVVVGKPLADSVRSFEAGSLSFEEVNVSYSEVEESVKSANLSGRILLDKPSNYDFTAYNVTVPADSTVNLTARINTHSAGSDQLYMWALGSAGGSTTVYETSDFEVSQATNNVNWRNIIFNSSVSSGTQINIPYNNSVDGFVSGTPVPAVIKNGTDSTPTSRVYSQEFGGVSYFSGLDGQYAQYDLQNSLSSGDELDFGYGNKFSLNSGGSNSYNLDSEYDIDYQSLIIHGDGIGDGWSGSWDKDPTNAFYTENSMDAHCACEENAYDSDFGTSFGANPEDDGYFKTEETYDLTSQVGTGQKVGGIKVNSKIEVSQFDDFGHFYVDVAGNRIIDVGQTDDVETVTGSSTASGTDYADSGDQVTIYTELYGWDGAYLDYYESELQAYRLQFPYNTELSVSGNQFDQVSGTLDSTQTTSSTSILSGSNNFDISTDYGGKPVVAFEHNKENTPPVVDALNTPGNNLKVNSTSPSLSLDVSDPDGDSINVEYFLNGTSIGTDSGVSSGSSSSLEASNLDWGTTYEWNATLKDGNGGTASSSTYEFTTQSRPTLSSFSWNNSDPAYGDTVRLEADISDPENDYISETFLSAEENGSQIFSGNGSKDSGLWVSDPVKVDEANVWYNGSVFNSTDTHGGTATFNTGNTDSFYIDNPPPRISSAKLVDDRNSSDRRLELVLDDRGQEDISSESGISNVRSFTNSSLVAGVQSSSLASDITVSDFPGLSSDPFTANFTVSNSGLKDDPGYTGNLSSQLVVQTLNITNKAGAELNYRQVFNPPSRGENLTKTEIKGKVQPDSTVSNTAEWKGDWIQEQTYNTSFGSGQVVYGGGIQERFNATQNIYTNNTQSSVDFDIDFTEAVSTGFSSCQLVNDTVQPVAAGHAGNHSFVKSCNPGKEISYIPVQKTDLGDKYRYNLTTRVEVFSELTSEQEHWIGIPQARLDKWPERNPDDTEAYVDGQSSEVRVEQGVVNDTEYVFIVVSDEFGSSSLHTGEHTASLIYTEGGDSSSGTGSSGSPGQIGDPIEEVEGEDYSWDLYNVRSQEQENVGFSIAGVPGREFERRLAVRNTGDQPFTLELECVSQGDACDWVETSVDKIRLDTQDNTVSYFDVNGRVPTTAEPDDTYRFSIRVSDPSFDESTPSTSGSASADFVVSISPFFGSVIEGIRNLLSWKEWTPPEWAPSGAKSIPYPFAALPLLSSIAVYGLLGLVQRQFSWEVSQYDEIGKFIVALLVFVVVTGLA